MIRYLDSGLNGVADSLGLWLNAEVVPTLRSFKIQAGFYDGAAMRGYLPILRQVVEGGGSVRLVIGANSGDPCATADLAALLPLVTADGRGRITIVALAGALFHPKTVHIVREDGSAAAVVSSSNFTRMGLGHSVEAGVILDALAAPEAVANVQLAIDRWGDLAERGVCHVRTMGDIEDLRVRGLVVTPEARRALRARQRTGTTAAGRGTRPVGWVPPPGPAVAVADGAADEVEEMEIAAPPGPPGEAVAAPVMPVGPGAIVHRWAKLLRRSDAQQVPDGTNATGKFRLGRGRFPVDQSTWFREVLFGDLAWEQTERRGLVYDEVYVPFQVSRHGDPWVPLNLKLDHGAHRVADQNNVPTVMSWGPVLGAWLRTNNQIGNWVTIERDVEGTFWLSFRDTRPEWVP